MSVCAVVGAQYGSEGKGAVVAHIANQYNVHVRVGGPNAGHTIWHNDIEYKMQMLPCGWINPNASIVLGRGLLIDPRQLIKEIEIVAKVDASITERLFIDAKAGIISPQHKKEEGGVHGRIHARIGSTGKGVGAARAARVKRNPLEFYHLSDIMDEYGNADFSLGDFCTPNTPYIFDDTKQILLEGTQGCHLSLIHGPWPFVTSHDTNAAQLAADCGIAPHRVNRVILVARTFPIRVAGNSGPLDKEIAWATLSDEIGRDVEEKTTVTQLVRRVGRWDDELFKQAVVINSPHEIAITFMDYLFPACTNEIYYDRMPDKSMDFIKTIERTAKEIFPMCIVTMLGTGPRTIVDLPI